MLIGLKNPPSEITAVKLPDLGCTVTFYRRGGSDEEMAIDSGYLWMYDGAEIGIREGMSCG